ncbi:hypothetical protein Drorol1_Dr00001890 [Drosera rotundifolia]
MWNQEPPTTVVAVESVEKGVKDLSRGKGQGSGTDAPGTESNPSHSRPLVAGTGPDGTGEAMILEQTMRLVKETLELKDLVKAFLSKKGTKALQGSDLQRIAQLDLRAERRDTQQDPGTEVHHVEAGDMYIAVKGADVNGQCCAGRNYDFCSFQCMLTHMSPRIMLWELSEIGKESSSPAIEKTG